ncbi:MAG TPA: hypothetical protein VHQ65_17490 [Thermoanaerobaculia bacterium]|nr:hypothetical protein [Thermoanaerobaculia bacterium]
MKRLVRFSWVLVVVLALVGFLAGAAGISSAAPGTMVCLRFPDNASVDWEGYGQVCAFNGGGCLDCYTECPGGQPCAP